MKVLHKELADAIKAHLPYSNLMGIYENGNTTIALFEDGTKMVHTTDKEFKYDFATNIDIKITNYCENNCPFCFENSTTDGKYGNLNHPIFNTLEPYQEVALGGGNPLSHPNLSYFLTTLKNKRVVANITVRQDDFIKDFDKLYDYYKQGLLHGIGVSLSNPTPELIEKLQKIPTAIIHTIVGIVTPKQIEMLKDKGLKILFLGYKERRKGVDYLKDHTNIIKDNTKYLCEHINDISEHFYVVSFDNLAIEQLGMQEKCTEEEWIENYMGDDGTQTFYIDLVKEEYAMNSTYLKRFKFTEEDTIKGMFKTCQKK